MATDNACPICQDTLHGHQSVGCTVPCGHVFHRKCFETWQVHSASRKCPCCMVNMRGFIDKIHITLPVAPSVDNNNDNDYDNLMEEPSIALQRRKALTREKAKRSAMMRHGNRRLGRADAEGSNLETSENSATEETRNDASTRVREHSGSRVAAATNSMAQRQRQRPNNNMPMSLSLSASLQRVPADPIKRAKMEDLVFDKGDHGKLENLDRTSMRRYLANAYSDADDLGEPIPDVAASIMRSIEQSIIPPKSISSKQRYHKQQQYVRKGKSSSPISVTTTKT